MTDNPEKYLGVSYKVISRLIFLYVLFKPEKRRAIVQYLLKNQSEEPNIREISEKINLSYQNCFNHVKELEKNEILILTRNNNFEQKIKLNPSIKPIELMDIFNLLSKERLF